MIRKRLHYQHKNAPAHRSRIVKQKLKESEEMQALPHLVYIPGIALSDYGLLRSIVGFLSGRQSNTFNKKESS